MPEDGLMQAGSALERSVIGVNYWGETALVVRRLHPSEQLFFSTCQFSVIEIIISSHQD